MKNSKLLAKSITLGLIFAMPYVIANAADIVINSDTSYNGPYNAEDGGVKINSNVTLSGNDTTEMVISGSFTGYPRALQIDGTISTAKSLTVNGGTYLTNSGKITGIDTVTLTNTVNKHSGSGALSPSLDNRGTIENVNNLVLGGYVTNTGTINVNSINNANDGTVLQIGNQADGKITVTTTANIDQLGNKGEFTANTINLNKNGNGIHNQENGVVTAENITGEGYIHNAGSSKVDADTINVTEVSNSAGATIITSSITANTFSNNGTVKASEDAAENVLGYLNAKKFTNSGTLTVSDTNVSESINNSGTLTLDKIGSADNAVSVTNQKNANLTVDGDTVASTFSNQGTADLNSITVNEVYNSGTFIADNFNAITKVSNTNGASMTVDKIGTAENTVRLDNSNNSTITVNGDAYVNNLSNNGTMTVDGSITGSGYFSRNENASLTADKLVVTADGWNEINGKVDVDNMDVNGTMAVHTDKLDVSDTTNINANLQFRAASGNSQLNNVNLNNTSLQIGGKSLTITGNMNVSGTEARLETWVYDNNKESAKTINVNGNLTLEEGAELLVTNTAGDESKVKVNNIILKDGATLNNGSRYASSLGSDTKAFEDFSVTTLTGTNANIINEGKMQIGTLNGDNNNIEVHSLDKAQITITTNNDTNLQVTGTSEATDNFDRNNLADSLQSLADTVDITSGEQLDNVVAEEGKIFGRMTAKVDDYGNVIAGSVVEEGHIANEGITELANVALMAWRAENDEMHQRMGELRSSKGEAGIWARMKRGESESGDMNIKNQYSTYQLGYDERVGDSNWYLGGAISRTEGKSSFATGSGENQSTGFTVYGTYVGDDGQYVDLSAKYARLDNEFDVIGRGGLESTGDYRNNGYAFSAEYGKRIEAGNDFWVEPQVQLTYGHLSSANYTTSRGVMATQEAMDSVVGRVGFAAGKDIGAGNVYVKASYLYDFDGDTSVDTSVTMNDGVNSRTYEQDLGGGWFEFGIGTNINLSETSHLYFDVERAVGGDIDTPWQWNAGVRFDF